MNCPQCGEKQPFDIRCVRCGKDLIDGKRARYLALFYRFAVGVLLATICTMAYLNNRSPNLPSTSPPSLQTPSPPSTPLADLEGFLPSKDTQPTTPQSVQPAFYFFTLEKIPGLSETFYAFQEKFPGPIAPLPLNAATDTLESEGHGAIVVADQKSPEILNRLQRRGNIKPIIFLPLNAPAEEENLENRAPSQANVLRLANHLPLAKETQTFQEIFENAPKVLAIVPSLERAPNESTLRENLIPTEIITADDAELGRLEGLATDERPILVFHGFQKTALTTLLKTLALPQDAIVLVGISRDESETETPAFTDTPVLLHLHLSAKGLGRQGAELAMATDLSEANKNLWPRTALEINLHVQRALALGGERLIQEMSRKAERQGFSVRLVP